MYINSLLVEDHISKMAKLKGMHVLDKYVEEEVEEEKKAFVILFNGIKL